jgi:hypothetical protein
MGRCGVGWGGVKKVMKGMREVSDQMKQGTAKHSIDPPVLTSGASSERSLARPLIPILR